MSDISNTGHVKPTPPPSTQQQQVQQDAPQRTRRYAVGASALPALLPTIATEDTPEKTDKIGKMGKGVKKAAAFLQDKMGSFSSGLGSLVGDTLEKTSSSLKQAKVNLQEGIKSISAPTTSQFETDRLALQGMMPHGVAVGVDGTISGLHIIKATPHNSRVPNVSFGEMQSGVSTRTFQDLMQKSNSSNSSNLVLFGNGDEFARNNITFFDGSNPNGQSYCSSLELQQHVAASGKTDTSGILEVRSGMSDYLLEMTEGSQVKASALSCVVQQNVISNLIQTWSDPDGNSLMLQMINNKTGTERYNYGPPEGGTETVNPRGVPGFSLNLTKVDSNTFVLRVSGEAFFNRFCDMNNGSKVDFPGMGGGVIKGEFMAEFRVTVPDRPDGMILIEDIRPPVIALTGHMTPAD